MHIEGNDKYNGIYIYISIIATAVTACTPGFAASSIANFASDQCSYCYGYTVTTICKPPLSVQLFSCLFTF